MPTPRRVSMTAILSRRLYVSGGLDGRKDLSVFEVYDSAQCAWGGVSPQFPVKTAAIRAAAGCSCRPAINEKLYLVGGWRISSPLPPPRSGLAVGVMGASVFTMGDMTAAASWGTLRILQHQGGISGEPDGKKGVSFAVPAWFTRSEAGESTVPSPPD